MMTMGMTMGTVPFVTFFGSVSKRTVPNDTL